MLLMIKNDSFSPKWTHSIKKFLHFSVFIVHFCVCTSMYADTGYSLMKDACALVLFISDTSILATLDGASYSNNNNNNNYYYIL